VIFRAEQVETCQNLSTVDSARIEIHFKHREYCSVISLSGVKSSKVIAESKFNPSVQEEENLKVRRSVGRERYLRLEVFDGVRTPLLINSGGKSGELGRPE
jgi:hypothetical protein